MLRAAHNWGRGSPWDSGDGRGAGRSSQGRRSLTTRTGNAEAQQAPADYQEPARSLHRLLHSRQYAPPPADPADEIEHLAQLHTSGALTDEEFASAKAKILGS